MTEATKCPKCDNDVQGADLRRGSCPFCGYVDYSPVPEAAAPKSRAKVAEADSSGEADGRGA